MRTLKLPDETRLPEADFDGRNMGDAKYRPIMKELGLENASKDEIDRFRYMVIEKTQEIGEEYSFRAFLDYCAGKLKSIEDAPLYRKPDGNGGFYLTNIPDDYKKWLYFAIWLNELVSSME